MKFRYSLTKSSGPWAYRMLAFRHGVRAAVLAMRRAGYGYAAIRFTFSLV